MHVTFLLIALIAVRFGTFSISLWIISLYSLLPNIFLTKRPARYLETPFFSHWSLHFSVVMKHP